MKRRSSVISVNQLPGPFTFVEKFGARGDGVTNDTVPIQAAIASMSAKGTAAGHLGVLYLTPGKTYKVDELRAASNVMIWAYGAQFVFDMSANGSIFNNLFSNPVSNFEFRGGWIQGSPALGANRNGLVFRNLTNAKIVDVRVTLIPHGSPIFVCDSSQVWIDRCTVSQCCTSQGTGNSINLVCDHTSDTKPLTDISVTNCLVEGYGSEGISIVPTTDATQTDGMRIRIENNTIIARNQPISTGNPPASGIEVENGGTAAVPVESILIAGNTIDGFIPSGLVLTTSLTGTTANGSATVTGVAGTGNSASLQGLTITGTNIPANTTLLTGGGTATWVLSQAATGAGSTSLTVTSFNASTGLSIQNDNAILDPAVNKAIVIADNNIRAVGSGIRAVGSSMEIANNRITNALQNPSSGTGIVCSMNTGTQLSAMTGDTNTSTHPQTITNVSGANNTSAVNGMLVQGTGITVGTTIVTGGGTSVWTLSLPATATNTGVALTAMPQMKGISIIGNNLNLQPDNPGISVQQATNGAIKNNLIRYETGSVVDGGEGNSGLWLNCLSNFRIQGNNIDYAPENGIFVSTSNDIKVTDNQILNPAEASSNGSTSAGTNGVHFTATVVGPATLIAGNSFDDTRIQLTGVTGDTDNVGHPTTITNVAGGNNTSRVNGMYVTGAGIPALTRVVSGGGTSTWTLSASTTAAAVGVALTTTARAMTRGVLASGTNSLNNRATGFITSTGNSTTVTGF